MDPGTVRRGLGGCARWTDLAAHLTRRDLTRAVRGGLVLRLGRGVYPVADTEVVRASLAGGTGTEPAHRRAVAPQALAG